MNTEQGSDKLTARPVEFEEARQEPTRPGTNLSPEELSSLFPDDNTFQPAVLQRQPSGEATWVPVEDTDKLKKELENVRKLLDYEQAARKETEAALSDEVSEHSASVEELGNRVEFLLRESGLAATHYHLASRERDVARKENAKLRSEIDDLKGRLAAKPLKARELPNPEGLDEVRRSAGPLQIREMVGPVTSPNRFARLKAGSRNLFSKLRRKKKFAGKLVSREMAPDPLA